MFCKADLILYTTNPVVQQSAREPRLLSAETPPERPVPLRARPAERVDASSLAVVRVALGVVATLSAVRTLAYGWADRLYSAPAHRFTYLWLGWVPQPGPVLVRVILATVALSGVAVALGWHTRPAAAALLVAFGWLELVDATTYLNHYWFVTLLAVLGVAVPFGAAWSLDARRAGGPATVARGWIWLLRFQVGVVYASAGLAKLQADWLVQALPLRLWLPARADLPLVGGIVGPGTTAQALAVAGAAFDCAIVPLLLWRRTRAVAWLVLVAFHVCTWLVFPIGVFPWLMIGVSTVFFDPSWPRRWTAWVAGRLQIHWAGQTDRRRVVAASVPPAPHHWRRRACTAAAIAWVVVQVGLPLRHLAYPGDHRWTAEGYRFAWNVLLVERSGSVTFSVREPATGRSWTADPEALYTRAQVRAMSSEPDMIHQAAQAIARAESVGGREVEVRVDAWLSLNGRPATRLIDPTIDLAHEPRSLAPKPWILPPS